jgi:hypothetical protein
MNQWRHFQPRSDHDETNSDVWTVCLAYWWRGGCCCCCLHLFPQHFFVVAGSPDFFESSRIPSIDVSSTYGHILMFRCLFSCTCMYILVPVKNLTSFGAHTHQPPPFCCHSCSSAHLCAKKNANQSAYNSVTNKVEVFWVLTRCSVFVGHHSGGSWCLHLQGELGGSKFTTHANLELSECNIRISVMRKHAEEFMSVCLPAGLNSADAGRIYIKFGIGVPHYKLWTNSVLARISPVYERQSDQH